MDGQKSTGLTRDTGWQIGVRRTLDLPFAVVWDWLISKKGTGIWLGTSQEIRWEKGTVYQLDDGTSGKVRVYQPGSHIRISRYPQVYPRSAVIQIRVVEKGEKTLIAFHEEHLPSEEERLARKAHYLEVFQALNDQLADG